MVSVLLAVFIVNIGVMHPDIHIYILMLSGINCYSLSFSLSDLSQSNDECCHGCFTLGSVGQCDVKWHIPN